MDKICQIFLSNTISNLLEISLKLNIYKCLVYSKYYFY